MFKRTLAFILMLVMTCSMLAGCGGQSQPTNTGTNTEASTPAAGSTADQTKLKGEIEMWSTFTDLENKVLVEKVVPAFNRAYPDIKVKITQMPGGDDYKKQILQAAMSGTTPDLARIDIIDVAQYANEDYLMKLDDMPDFAKIKADTFEGPMSTCIFNGSYYAIPLDTNTKIAIYNKRLLAQAGFNDAPGTMDELQQASEKLKSANVMGIAISGTGAWSIAPYFLSLGGEFTDDKNSKATGYLNSPASIKALETIVSWNDGGLAGKSLIGGEGTWEGFNAAHYMMIDDGPWWYPANKEQAEVKDNVIFAPIPSGTGGSVSVVGGEDTVIFNASKNKEQAYAFAKFLASDEAQTIFATELNMMPVCKATAQKPVIKDNKMLNVYTQQLGTAWARTPSPKWGDIDTVLSDAFGKAIRKETTAQAALDGAAKKIDALLQQK